MDSHSHPQRLPYSRFPPCPNPAPLARAFSAQAVLPILRAMLQQEKQQLNRQPKRRWKLNVGARVLLLAVLSSLQVCAHSLPQSSALPPLRPQPIEDAPALRSFQQALARTLAAHHADPNAASETAAITRILHYGDSHVAADWLTGALRQRFQADFGDAGSGFLYAARPWAWYTRAEVASAASAGWRTDGLKVGELAFDNQLGLAGVSFTATRAGERLQFKVTGARFEFYVLQQPRAGSIECWLDGELYHPALPLDAPTALTLFVPVEAETDGPHTLELRTVTPGPVRVFGLVAEQNRAGVIYDALGLNGARASRPLAWDWRLTAEQISQRAPKLIVVAYGSNEAGDADLNLTEYQRAFTELLRRLHEAAPDAALLVITPPDRAVFSNGRWQALRSLPGISAAQCAAAHTTGAACWDLYAAMGGAGAIQRWATQKPALAQADRVHLTATGYRLVADALYQQLLTEFAASQRLAQPKH